MNKTIAIIKGDGIGPEIVTEAMGILDAVAAKFGHTFTYVDAPMGGNAIDKFGVPLPDSSLATCRGADSVLLGAVGGRSGTISPPPTVPSVAFSSCARHGALYKCAPRQDVLRALRRLPAAR